MHAARREDSILDRHASLDAFMNRVSSNADECGPLVPGSLLASDRDAESLAICGDHLPSSARLIADRATGDEVGQIVVLLVVVDVVDVNVFLCDHAAAPMAVERTSSMLVEEHDAVLIHPDA